jgi:hypothetical protein
MRYITVGVAKWVAPALAAVVLAASAAAQPIQDLRSPDARDAATQVQPAPDLRSPDAQDAAEGRGAWNAPRVMVVKMSRPQVSGSNGFDWTDAGIGAGGALGLVLLAVGGTLVVAHGRRAGAKRAQRAAMIG